MTKAIGVKFLFVLSSRVWVLEVDMRPARRNAIEVLTSLLKHLIFVNFIFAVA